jgi:hypothetical protein
MFNFRDMLVQAQEKSRSANKVLPQSIPLNPFLKSPSTNHPSFEIPHDTQLHAIAQSMRPFFNPERQRIPEFTGFQRTSDIVPSSNANLSRFQGQPSSGKGSRRYAENLSESESAKQQENAKQ